MSEPLPIEVSALAAEQVRTAEAWWQSNRPNAPGAIRSELERATSLIALQPGIGTRARNSALPGVRRLHLARVRYDLYYRLVEAPARLQILAFWRRAIEAGFDVHFTKPVDVRALTAQLAAAAEKVS